MTISDDRRDEFIEAFARAWTSRGASRTEGRIAAYLLLDESDGVTAAQIAADLDVSAGSVSTATRSLVDAGFVHRERDRYARVHRLSMASDVWGRFLEHERPYLQMQRDLAARALPGVPPGSPAHERLTNMHRYMAWLLDEVRLSERWAEVTSRDGAPSTGPSADSPSRDRRSPDTAPRTPPPPARP